jgi:hypothetical protein
MNIRVSAADWNAAISRAGAIIPMGGRGILVNSNETGYIIGRDPLAGWRHPWNIIPRWRQNRWYLNIRPGFVNGEPPFVVGSAPEPLPSQTTQPADLELPDVPWVPVPATRLEQASIPAFFREKGVEPLPDVGSLVSNGRINTQALLNAGKSKKLRVAEAFLSVSRARLVTEIQQIDAAGTSGTILQYGARYDTTDLERNGPRARLLLGAEFPERKIPDLVQRLFGLEQDDSEDRLHLATVYFLSPDDKEDLNEDWTPFIKHRAFWNLAHASQTPVPNTPPFRPPFFTGLAGGIGDAFINQIEAVRDTLEQNVSNFFQQDDPSGAFWSV